MQIDSRFHYFLFLFHILLSLAGCNHTSQYTYSYEVINDTDATIGPLNVNDKNFPANYDLIESRSSAGTISIYRSKIPNNVEIKWESAGNKYSKQIDFQKHLSKRQRNHVEKIIYLIKSNDLILVIFDFSGNTKRLQVPKEAPQDKILRRKKQKLLVAIQSKKEKEAIQLLKGGIPVSPQSVLDSFATNLAVRYNQLALLGYLLNNGAKMEFGDTSALSTAARHGNQKVVEMLVESGANVNYGRSFPLNHAIEKSHLKIARYLIAKGSEPNKTVFSQTPMAHAIRTKDPNTVKVLLESGVDPNTIWNGETYTEFAKSIYGTPEIATMMEKWAQQQR